MDWFVKAFLKASLAWLAAGVTLGLAMAMMPGWAVYRPVHLHVLLLGFVTMMIFGVAYHVIPRFTGNALYSRRGATWHWWASNAGLLLMAGGFALRVHVGERATPLLASGGALAALGAYTFAYVIWRTIDGRVTPRASAPRPGREVRGVRLPVVEDGGASVTPGRIAAPADA